MLRSGCYEDSAGLRYQLRCYKSSEVIFSRQMLNLGSLETEKGNQAVDVSYFCDRRAGELSNV